MIWKEKEETDITIEEEPRKARGKQFASFFAGMSWGIFLAAGGAALVLYLYV